MRKHMLLDTALYSLECPECGSSIEWVFNNDPDWPMWYAKCCGRKYSMNVHKVTVRYENEEDF